MQKAIVDRLEKLLTEGEAANNDRAVGLWSQQVLSFLSTALGGAEASGFAALRDPDDTWREHALRIGCLQGLIAKGQAESLMESPRAAAILPVSPPATGADITSRKVFVVHGHDTEAKVSVARFLEKIGLQPVILHEQPSSGRTIIEKFEKYSEDIGFAVILLTPDDVGAPATNSPHLKQRARQNVVMELGYFMGRLGRTNVCALHKGGVELPSDYQGVLYVEMDEAGAWRTKLAQELVQARLSIELRGLLGS